MRIKITFNINQKNQLLPFNYQYPISAWVYRVFAHADIEFTNLLHEIGYPLENGKTFKLFTFSGLSFPPKTTSVAKLEKVNKLRENKQEPPLRGSDRMEVWANKAWLTLSFHLPQQYEKFIMGLFNNQKAFIGDKISGLDLQVESIEALKQDIPSSGTVSFKTITPIVMGIKEPEQPHEVYAGPSHPLYKELFLNNLLDKYKAAGGNAIYNDELDFRLVKIYPKTSLQIIKAFSKQETKVRGFRFDFELTAPHEIMEIGLNAGFGSMNSLGFGACEIQKDNNQH